MVDSKEIREFLSGYSPKTDPLDLAINKSLIDRKSFKPRVAGILLFCDEPSSKMPRKCSVKVSRYETKEDEPERDHLKEIIKIEGPLYRLIHDSVRLITEKMSGIRTWTTKGLANVAA